MSVAHDLGALIIKMNPYAGGSMEPHYVPSGTTASAAAHHSRRHPKSADRHSRRLSPNPQTATPGASPNPQTATPRR